MDIAMCHQLSNPVIGDSSKKHMGNVSRIRQDATASPLPRFSLDLLVDGSLALRMEVLWAQQQVDGQ